MATLRATVKSTLTNDEDWEELLTGGTFDAADFDREGMSLDNIPTVSGGVRIDPFAVIRWRSSNPFGPFPVSAEQQSFEVYIYDDLGYTTIEQAVSLAKSLLHDVYLTADDRALAHVIYTFISGEVPADELGGAPCQFIRFSVNHIRE